MSPPTATSSSASVKKLETAKVGPSSNYNGDEYCLVVGDFLEQLECPICNEVYRIPVHVCENGHSICQKCKSRLTRCGYCQGTYLTARNFSLENILNNCSTPCQFQERGCPDIVKLSNYTDHINSCAHNPDKPAIPTTTQPTIRKTSPPIQARPRVSNAIDTLFDELTNYYSDQYVPVVDRTSSDSASTTPRYPTGFLSSYGDRNLGRGATSSANWRPPRRGINDPVDFGMSGRDFRLLQHRQALASATEAARARELSATTFHFGPYDASSSSGSTLTVGQGSLRHPQIDFQTMTNRRLMSDFPPAAYMTESRPNINARRQEVRPTDIDTIITSEPFRAPSFCYPFPRLPPLGSTDNNSQSSSTLGPQQQQSNATSSRPHTSSMSSAMNTINPMSHNTFMPLTTTTASSYLNYLPQNTTDSMLPPTSSPVNFQRLDTPGGNSFRLSSSTLRTPVSISTENSNSSHVLASQNWSSTNDLTRPACHNNNSVNVNVSHNTFLVPPPQQQYFAPGFQIFMAPNQHAAVVTSKNNMMTNTNTSSSSSGSTLNGSTQHPSLSSYGIHNNYTPRNMASNNPSNSILTGNLNSGSNNVPSSLQSQIPVSATTTSTTETRRRKKMYNPGASNSKNSSGSNKLIPTIPPSFSVPGSSGSGNGRSTAKAKAGPSIVLDSSDPMEIYQTDRGSTMDLTSTGLPLVVDLSQESSDESSVATHSRGSMIKDNNNRVSNEGHDPQLVVYNRCFHCAFDNLGSNQNCTICSMPLNT